MKQLFEAEKNYIKCAILMVIVGIGLIVLGERNMGIGCIVVGITFGVAAVYMIVTNDKERPIKEKKVKKEKSEDIVEETQVEEIAEVENEEN